MQCFFILPRTALARFRQAQLEEGKVKERRPFLASECTELPKAEKWRRQVPPLRERCRGCLFPGVLLTTRAVWLCSVVCDKGSWDCHLRAHLRPSVSGSSSSSQKDAGRAHEGH
uniref:Uncharacterized protein n=1 Tax=Marmota marmota marmota TaxID=9994 RepID=A0A8C6EYU6_MARMA